MSTHDQPSGGIRAHHIRADNVVSGAQIQGGDPQHTISLVQLAQAIQRGDITADDIVARNLVSGLQYIAHPTDATLEDLRSEVTALRPKVDTARFQATLAFADQEWDRACSSLREAGLDHPDLYQYIGSGLRP